MSSIWLSPYKAWQKLATHLALFKYTFARATLNPLRLRSLDYNANKLERRRCILPTRLDQTQVQSESRSSNLTLLPWKQNPNIFANEGNLKVFHPARCRLSKLSRNFPGGLPVKTPKAVQKFSTVRNGNKLTDQSWSWEFALSELLLGFLPIYGPIKFPKPTLKN